VPLGMGVVKNIDISQNYDIISSFKVKVLEANDIKLSALLSVCGISTFLHLVK
jgi:hypothetical protein